MLLIAAGSLVIAACTVDAAEPTPTASATTAAGSSATAPTTGAPATAAPIITTATTEPPSTIATTSPPTTPPSTEPAPAILDEKTAQRFAAALSTRELAAGAPAVQITVSFHGHRLHSSAYGIADPRTGRSATPDDRFRIASISKVLTATVVLQMVEDGTWSLDDTPLEGLARQLGTTLVDPRIAAVSLRDLLSHTSGFDVNSDLFFKHGASSCPDAARQGLGGVLEADPGTRYEYSNLNFCILGLMVERTTGDRYEEVVRSRLLEPLGIDDMRMAGTFDVEPGDVAHASTTGRNYMETLGAAGAWIATADDVATILDSLDLTTAGWHPLDAAIARQAHVAIGHPDPPENFAYGLGLFLWDDGSWGHTGSVESARSIAVHLTDGTTVVMLASALKPYDTDVLRSWIAESFAQGRGLLPAATTTAAPAA